MQFVPEFGSIVGDDDGFVAPRLSQIPSEFGFSALKQHTDTPLTNARWNNLIDFVSRYYRHFEIVGLTYADFQENLQLAYDIGADTFERLLEVYQDDIAKPILGRTEKTTYDLTDEDTGTKEYEDTRTDNLTEEVNASRSDSYTDTDNSEQTNNLTEQTNSSGQSNHIDVPVNSTSPNTQTPSTIDTTEESGTVNNTGTVGNDRTVNHEGSGTDNSTRNNTGTVKNAGNATDNLTHTQKGTVETVLSDLGVRPNYESLNGFLDNNRTDLAVFAWLFRNCFNINDVMAW